MAYHFFVAIAGEKQGTIAGSAQEKAYAGQIVGLAMNQTTLVPHDPGSGLPTGPTAHQPLLFTKAWDKSTPRLLQAMFTNETLRTCVFTFIQAARGPLAASLAFTITLTNARIVGITQYTATPAQLNQFGETTLEDVSLTFQKIQWTSVNDNASASDDWQGVQ